MNKIPKTPPFTWVADPTRGYVIFDNREGRIPPLGPGDVCSMLAHIPAWQAYREATAWWKNKAGEHKARVHELEARIEELERIKRAAARLRSIPAVQQILGSNHTPNCCCGLCETNAAITAAEADTPKLVDLGGGLSSYENLERNPPERRAALAKGKP